MSVSGIHNNDIYVSLYESFHTFHHVAGNADACTAKQTTLLILCGERILDLFFDILDGDKSLQMKIFVDDRQLFFSRLGKNLFCLF